MARLDIITPIEIDRDDRGNPVIQINLGANAASDDWLRAARLKEEGRQKEFEAMEANKCYVELTREEER